MGKDIVKYEIMYGLYGTDRRSSDNLSLLWF